MINRFVAVCFALGAALFFAASPASAATLVWADLDGNDCPDVFGGSGPGFSGCDIGNGLPLDPDISPIIIKFDDALEVDEVSSHYEDVVDGSEFSFVGTTWTYTPGTGDPLVKFWAVKQGSEFRLYWNIADNNTGACSSIPGSGDDNFTLTCVAAAISTTTGTTLNSGGGDELSHLSFYNSGGDITQFCAPGTCPAVPEPASMLLLGSGLLGLGAARRRRKRA